MAFIGVVENMKSFVSSGTVRCARASVAVFLSVLNAVPVFMVPLLLPVRVEAAAETFTSRADFNTGYYAGTDGKTREGQVTLAPDGTWGARVWKTPMSISQQTPMISDGNYVYAIPSTDTYFMRYLPAENRWQHLADAPAMAYYGADFTILGNYIYAIFGGYQNVFARYHIPSNTWETLSNTPDLIGDGGTIGSDGTDIYILRGGSVDFWKYTVATGAWTTLVSPPGNGAGASLEYQSGFFYTMRGGNRWMYKYEIATQIWTRLADAPIDTYYDTNSALVDGYIYTTLRMNGTTFGLYRFNIAGNTWDTLATPPYEPIYNGVVHVSGENKLYVFRGNGSYDFWKYNIGTNSYDGLPELPAGVGTGADLLYYNGSLYGQRGSNTTTMYQYTVATSTWSTKATAIPFAFNNYTRGTVAGANLYYFRGSNTLDFYSYAPGSDAWTKLADPPAAVSDGGTLVYPGSGDFIYATRGNWNGAFWRYSISGNSWSDPLVADPTGVAGNAGTLIATDGTDFYLSTGVYGSILKYTVGTNTWSTVTGSLPFTPYVGSDMAYYSGQLYFLAGMYKSDVWEYTIASNTWRKLPNVFSAYGYDQGAYNGASLEGDGAGNFYATLGGGFTTFFNFTASANNYPVSGTWTSDVIDLTYVSSFTSFAATSTTPGDSTVAYETRTSTDRASWSDWAAVSGGTIASPARQYLEIRATLNATTDRSQTPILSDITVTYTGDTSAPTNPTAFTGTSQQSGGTSLTSGNSYPHNYPYFTWSGAADGQTGIAGYYVYFGNDPDADPQVAGSLQTAATFVNTTPLVQDTYYLRLQTKDTIGNVSSAVTGFTYVYNGVEPASVTFTATSDFSGGTATDVSTAGDAIRLSSKAGFWKEPRVSLFPVAKTYDSDFAYVSSTGKMYVLRGANTVNFYEYDMAADTWTAKADLPAAVYGGGAISEGQDGYIYAIRGAGWGSFYRYDIAANTWDDAAATDAPTSFSYGASLKYDGSRYMYALRGNNDEAFYRYDTQMDAWDTLTSADFGAPQSQVNNFVSYGGDLTYDPDGFVYAIQGNTRSGFAVYSIATESWTPLTNLPALAYDGSNITYDEETDSIYYISGWGKPFLYQYSIANQTWTRLPDAPVPFGNGSAFRAVDGILYVLRGQSTTGFYMYDIGKRSWYVPTIGLFGDTLRSSDIRGFSWGADIIKGDGDNYYLARGNIDTLFSKYNGVTGEVTRLSDMPLAAYYGNELVYDSVHGKIYATANYWVRRFFVYDIATDVWSEETLDPPPTTPGTGAALVFDGARYIYYLRGGGNQTFARFDTDPTTPAGSRWGNLGNTPAGVNYGTDMVYKGGYIYTLRGGSTPGFYRYDPSIPAWNDAVVTDLPTGVNVYRDGFLVDIGPDTLMACRGENTTTCYTYSIAANAWTALDNAKVNIYSGGAAASNGTDKVFVIPGGGTNTYANGLYTYVIQSADSSFEESGSFISATHDLINTYRFANLSVTYASAANATITPSTRTSDDGESWTDWAAATELKTVGSAYEYKINSSPKRYTQVKFVLTSSDGIYAGTISDYTINYYSDQVSPINPETVTAYSSATQSATLTNNTWYNHVAPNFDWPDAGASGGAGDTATGSGVVGYYTYFGTDSDADPETLGTYATPSAYTAGSLVSGQTYYLRIKAKDDAGNAASQAWQPFVYKYDTDVPTNPTTVVVDPPGYSSTNSYTMSWLGATDSASQVSQYCYKTGAAGSTDTCIAEDSVTGIASYKTGTNTFYVRTKDTAGNITSDYVTASYYYSSTAPSAPLGLDVTPDSSTLNAFAFAWSPPSLYYGQQSGLRYYYSVNALPTEDNVNSVGLSVTYLPTDAYATQKGTNTFYVVAMDEAGNIDYNNYASVEFTAETTAPGIPQNLDISDVSIKETSNWKLAVTWDAPESTGSGIATYKVYSSTTATACTTDMTGFSYVASTIGTSFVDSDLAQIKHYYCVKACDSTNECSAPSSTVSMIPDGKWRIAPTMTASPSATIKTKTATVIWSTSRSANSFIKYGTKSGDYGNEVGSSTQVTNHSIQLIGLNPGTTYYYKALWTDEDGNQGSSGELTLTTNPAPAVADVKVVDIGITSAHVSFTVSNASKVTVKYGKTPSYGLTETLVTATATNTQVIDLTSLEEGTLYHVQIVGEDEEGNTFAGDDYTFETLPTPKISGLRIQQVAGQAAATVRLIWATNTPLSSIVNYYPENDPSKLADSIQLALTKKHETILTNLKDDTEYVIVVKGKDVAGNEATPIKKEVKTAVDFRPPEVQNFTVESTIVGVGQDALAQIVVSWDTDEPSSTQVEYALGTGVAYGDSTQEDSNMTLNHSVTIPGLTPAKIYHLRAVSKDKGGNVGSSQDTVIVTPRSTKDALNIVIENLTQTFGFLGGLKK